MAVFVLDRSGNPLMPCSEKRARLLLARGRARVHRVMPFAIRIVDRRTADCVLQPVRLKLDPGSKGTGVAIVREVEPCGGEARRPGMPPCCRWRN
ncbi:RRXRR domain-containing protein [Cupriavidus sp. CV2]|uniref:RRXRR domain-containing protein n=1 Tax=Cupriavidus ulmosensis TaxID=3065913 RepID=UPI00296AAAC0|nr:RRXRR domain-containing protein [Cupriavidus sp. CV2]MDW3689322.1 RRXRR domain-containing protein [Cupriavidus sp. CV2]